MSRAEKSRPAAAVVRLARTAELLATAVAAACGPSSAQPGSSAGGTESGSGAVESTAGTTTSMTSSSTGPVGECDATLVMEGDVLVETAAQLEALRGYTRVNGELAIVADDVQSLEPLGCLEAVAELSISGTDSLTGLDGLGALTSAPVISVLDNPSLLTLEGLGPLAEASSISISRNELLVDVEGLASLRHVGGLVIHSAPLTTLEGLRSLESVTEELRLSALHELATLEGLEKLAEAGLLVIDQVTVLEDFGGLAGLREAGEITLKAVGNLGPTGHAELVGMESLETFDRMLISAVDDHVDFAAFPALDLGTGPAEVIVGSGIDVIDMSALEMQAGLTLRLAAGFMDADPDVVELIGPTMLEQATAIEITVANDLVEVTGFEALSQVGPLGGDPSAVVLEVRSNAKLSALAFPALQAVEGSVEIVTNWMLPTCTAEGVVEGVQVSGQVTISDNLPDACGP